MNAERTRGVAERHNVANVCSDYQELIARPDIDAVTVVTTEDQHLVPVLAALERGKHVFVEKPMTTNAEDAEKMVESAAKSGSTLVPGHLLRFESRYATVKEQLESGNLGRILSLYARRNRAKLQGRIYKRTPLVLETAIYDIDTLLWYVGERVKSVRPWEGAAETGSGPDFGGTLHFEGGAVGVFQTSSLLPNKTPFLDDYMQVLGWSGVANVDILNSGLSFWTEDGAQLPDVGYEPRISGAAKGALREELMHFALCCLENRQSEILRTADAVETIRVCTALARSATENREIAL
jgi:UDP-N-acetylglucosamine 3-dehydrogenase